MKACCLYVLIGEGTVQACSQDCYLHVMHYDLTRRCNMKRITVS